MAKSKENLKPLYVGDKLHKRIKMASIKLDAPMTELVSDVMTKYLDSLKPNRQSEQQAA